MSGRAKRLAQAAKVLEQFKARHLCFPKLDIPSGPLASGRHEKIAVHQTVHGSKAEEILEKGLTIQKGELQKNNFSDTGNFGLRIQKHVDLGTNVTRALGPMAWTSLWCWVGQVSALHAQDRLH